MPKNLARDKCFSLFCDNVSDEEKSVVNANHVKKSYKTIVFIALSQRGRDALRCQSC